MVGLIADPDLPSDVARHLAQHLPRALRERVSDRVTWEVPIGGDRVDDDELGELGMIEAARRIREREGWDVAVCRTDLPRRDGVRPVVTALSADHPVALLSLPALGAVRVHQRARDAVVRLVDDLVGEGTQRPRSRIGRLVAPTRRVEPPDEGIRERLVASGLRGQLRLLAGLVRDNRPWRLIRGLSRTLVAAFATAAVAVITSDVWSLSDTMSATRLAVATAASCAAIVVWLVAAHELWERPRERKARQLARLFNVATVLTLVLGVSTLYLALLAINVAVARFLIDAALFETELRHPVGWGQYAALGWLASSIGTVAGALGSGLESDEEVRRAAYGYRHRQRHRGDERRADSR